MSPAFWSECFKGLGGSYAVGKYLADKLQCDINSLSFAALNTPEIKEKLKIVFCYRDGWQSWPWCGVGGGAIRSKSRRLYA